MSRADLNLTSHPSPHAPHSVVHVDVTSGMQCYDLVNEVKQQLDLTDTANEYNVCVRWADTSHLADLHLLNDVCLGRPPQFNFNFRR